MAVATKRDRILKCIEVEKLTRISEIASRIATSATDTGILIEELAREGALTVIRKAGQANVILPRSQLAIKVARGSWGACTRQVREPVTGNLANV